MTKYKVVSSRPATSYEIAQSNRIAAAAENQLNTVRTAAQNWRNGVGLAGILVASSGALSAPSVVAAIPDPQGLFNGVWLVGIGMAIGLAAFVLSMRAAFGWPRAVHLNAPNAIQAWEVSEIEVTILALRASMILTAISLVVLAAAGAVMLFHVPFFIAFPGW